MFITRVVRNFEAAHKNGPPGGRCYENHGHSWIVTIEAEMPERNLDEYGWSVDFHVLKDAIDKYDHKDLNEFFEAPSAEHIAKQIYESVSSKIGDRGMVRFVEIQEGNGNTLAYTGPEDEAACTCYAEN